MNESGPIGISDGAKVIIDGRVYVLRIDPSNCVSLRHWHPEPHADGSEGAEKHHHHSARCTDFPRQATLVPVWEKAPVHVHDFGPDINMDAECSCGASRRPTGEKRGTRVWVECHNPADDDHPEGWTYERLGSVS